MGYDTLDNQYVKIIKPFIPSLLVGFGFLALVWWLRPSIYWLVGFVVLTTLYIGRDDIGRAVVSSFINVCFLLFIFLVWKTVGLLGVAGLVVGVLLVVGVILFRRRKLFINTIREIEKILWGKTNDRKPRL